MTNKAKRVTFWSVTYGIWGSDYKGMAWFDCKERAYAFYKSTDACDSPRHVSLSKSETIAHYRELVGMTEAEHGEFVDSCMEGMGLEDKAGCGGRR